MTQVEMIHLDYLESMTICSTLCKAIFASNMCAKGQVPNKACLHPPKLTIAPAKGPFQHKNSLPIILFSRAMLNLGRVGATFYENDIV